MGFTHGREDAHIMTKVQKLEADLAEANDRIAELEEQQESILDTLGIELVDEDSNSQDEDEDE